MWYENTSRAAPKLAYRLVLIPAKESVSLETQVLLPPCHARRPLALLDRSLVSILIEFTSRSS